VRSRRLLAVSASALLALTTLAACGDDDDEGSGYVAGATADCAAFEGVPATPGKIGEAPSIGKPEGDPPTELKTQDCLVGEGDEVTDTSTTYSWDYEGVSYSTGEVFDSSFERGEPADFFLDQVIPGWTDGLQGMKVGGRRMLVIPPDQAYGADGRPGIAPNETLVFVVDLVGTPTTEGS
jgi:peptidylprolyl isomerase